MLKTETRNPDSMRLDQMSTREILALMNRENRRSVDAVENALPQVEQAVEIITESLNKGGHLIYVGAGTSGRLGVLDASECPPTFGVSPDTVRGVIAGGPERLISAGEGAEDSYDNGVKDVSEVISPGDVVVGISAAGGARYVVGALEYAGKVGCKTVAVTSNPGTAVTAVADIAIVCDSGPEVLTGSTRLKAGNCQKFVLNMLSTAAMIKTGKVYENLMINLKPSNEKLKGRVIRITAAILDLPEEEAERLLSLHNFDIRETVENAKGRKNK